MFKKLKEGIISKFEEKFDDQNKKIDDPEENCHPSKYN